MTATTALTAELEAARAENELWRTREANRLLRAKARVGSEAERLRRAALTECERTTEDAQEILDRLTTDRCADQHRDALLAETKGTTP